MAILLTACEPNGTNFGSVRSYGANRAACGRQDITPLRSQAGYVTEIRGIGTTWLEEQSDTICISSGETGERYLAHEGWLGNSVRVRENGVTCAVDGLSYNGTSTYYFAKSADCPNDYPTDSYYVQIVHRWWSVDNGVYAQVTINSATLSL